MPCRPRRCTTSASWPSSRGSWNSASQGRRRRRFWQGVRGNLERLSDAPEWWTVINGEVDPVIEDRAFLDTALDHLPAGEWDLGTWQAWTDALKQSSGRKGRALFHPLRLALTGRETGPDLKHLLPLIGRAKTSARIAGTAG